jgi:DNA-binding NtrC family response regulator
MDVLLVDDNELNVRALTRVLKARHTVRVALNACQALAEVQARPPDVVICDFELGDETCTAFLRTLTACHPGTRRILYSASQPELWEELVRDHLVDVTLAKPITRDVLLATIDGG